LRELDVALFHNLLTALIFLGTCEFLFAQPFRLLHYTETSVYDHQTRDDSYGMFQQLGAQFNFITDHDSTGDAFNSPASLQQYAAVVFANTTGDAILDSAQRNHFEQYIANGGNVIGIHSATDTYRHSTANGGNTGSWDFFPELLGASVQQNPTHVNGTPVFSMHALQLHPLLAGIPDPWQKPEEYYYWQNGYFDSLNNSVLLIVDTTLGPNGQVNSYDLPRPTAWYKVSPGGNRIFYTSLGHAASNYTGDTTFMRLITNAVLWVSGITNTMDLQGAGGFMCYPNPAASVVNIVAASYTQEFSVSIKDLHGKEIYFKQFTGNARAAIHTDRFFPGIYFVVIHSRNEQLVKRIVVVE
jgi:type 1 glutamine amidotransferase